MNMKIGLDLMNSNSTEVEYQDIIIQEPELLLASLTQDQIAILKNPRYLNLIKVIQKGPLTLAEMAEEYAALAKDDEAKSESTVYRLLTDLKHNDLVQEAGKRLIEGKPLSQTLYSLTTKYIILDEQEIDWEGSDGQRIFQEIVKILTILYPDKSIDKEALLKWQLRFQRQVDEEKQKLISSKSPEIYELLSVWAPASINDTFEALGWLSVLLKNPDAHEDYLKCFMDAKDVDEASFTSKVDTTKISTTGAYRDVIRRYPFIKYLLEPDDPRSGLIEKPAYRPLFHILYDKPMTIKELVEKYNQVSTVSRTHSTISRYVKTLKEANLVIEMGIRVTQGKKATQKLYGPIARMIGLEKERHSWDDEKCEKCDWLLDTLIQLFLFLYPDLPKANKECLRQFHVATYKNVDYAFATLDAPENDNVRKLLHSYSGQDFYVIITSFLDHYIFLKTPNLHNRLRQCFSP